VREVQPGESSTVEETAVSCWLLAVGEEELGITNCELGGARRLAR
jgi:hypothetical protein